MERLFKNEPVHKPAEDAVQADIHTRLEKLFKKYSYIEPRDLLAMISTTSVGIINNG